MSLLTAKITRAELDDNLRWLDVIVLAMLAGIGFTVSLLIGELAFADDALRTDHVKIGVLTGTLTAAIVLRLRDRAYRRIVERETANADQDGIPDTHQRP